MSESDSDDLSIDEPLELVVDAEGTDTRLDWYLAQKFPTYSRTLLRRAINAGGIKVNGAHAKAAHRLRSGEQITVTLPEVPRQGSHPEPIPLDILYEDDDIAVINKPPAMVVHPGKGHWAGTLTSALQHHFGSLSTCGGATRPGIVHRLDRDTSGVIAVAKNDRAHFALSEQFAQRTVEKQYLAVVMGTPNLDQDIIDQPIGLHPYHREKMAIRRDDPSSRPARTRYAVLERFQGFATIQVFPQTGRTHQIRVHMEFIHCPVLCDRQYGSRARLMLSELSHNALDTDLLLDRQALHAWRLKFQHPIGGQPLAFEAPLPDDFVRTIDALRTWRKRS